LVLVAVKVDREPSTNNLLKLKNITIREARIE